MTDQQVFNTPLPDIQPADVWPPGWYTLRIARCEPKIQESTGKLVVDVEHRTLDRAHPAGIPAGMGLTTMVWLGTDEDPTCSDPMTFNVPMGGGKTLAKLWNAAGVLFTGVPLNQACAGLVDKQIMASVRVSKDGEFNRIYTYMPLGSREVSVDQHWLESQTSKPAPLMTADEAQAQPHQATAAGPPAAAVATSTAGNGPTSEPAPTPNAEAYGQQPQAAVATSPPPTAMPGGAPGPPTNQGNS